MRKKFRYAMPVILASVILMTGCTRNYDSDYLKEYKEYLEYAFGEYTVLSKEKRTQDGSPIPIITEYEAYEISYEDQEGRNHQFNFSNNEMMEWWVTEHAEIRLRSEVDELWETYFQEDFEKDRFDVHIWIDPSSDDKRDEYDKDLLSGRSFLFFKGEGLNFTSFNSKNLSRYDLGIKLTIYYSMGQDSPYYQKDDEFYDQLLSAINEFADERNQKSLLTGQVQIEYLPDTEEQDEESITEWSEMQYFRYDNKNDQLILEPEQNAE